MDLVNQCNAFITTATNTAASNISTNDNSNTINNNNNNTNTKEVAALDSKSIVVVDLQHKDQGPMVFKLVLKCSQICYATHPNQLYRQWNEKLTNEFFNQVN